MGVENLIKKGEEDKKNINKSFRLRPATAAFLENISEKIGLSQNEIVNSLIDDAGKTLELPIIIGEKLCGPQKVSEIRLSKEMDENCYFDFTISNENKIKCLFELREKLENIYTVTYSKMFYLKSFNDIIKLGIDSTYRYSEK